MATIIDTHKLDSFALAYIETALWSSYDDDGNSLDREYSVSDLSQEALQSIVADCDKFQRDNEIHLSEENLTYASEHSVWAMAGHDFWLTRNGHGAGFWDGDWVEPSATALDTSSKQFGSVDIYIGDDGTLYLSEPCK